MPGANLSSVSVSGRTRAKSDVAVCEGVPAALAVLSEAGSVDRAEPAQDRRARAEQLACLQDFALWRRAS